MPTREVHNTLESGIVEKAILKAGPVTIVRLQKLQTEGIDVGLVKKLREKKKIEFKELVRKKEADPADEEKFLSDLSYSDIADSGIDLGGQFEKPLDTVKLLLKAFFVNDVDKLGNAALTDDWIEENMSYEIFQKINQDASEILKAGNVPLGSQGG